MKIKEAVDRHMYSEFLVKDRALIEELGRLAGRFINDEIETVDGENEFPDNR